MDLAVEERSSEPPRGGGGGGVAAGNGEERAGGEGTRAAEAFQPPVPGARSLVKGLHPGQRPACPQ